MIVHGVLLDILGLGVLLVGESGIGKSECALDLVVRGHRLVADDIVELRCREPVVSSSAPARELTRHHMEIRGLGLINVQDLFGVASTRSSKRVELVVQLERWESGREYDRLGLDDEFYEVLATRIAADPHAGRARAATSRSWSRSRPATSCCARAATTPRAGWSSRLDGQLDRRRGRTSTPTRRGVVDAGEAARRAPRPARTAVTARFVILTGLSGSGKSQAIRALEDLGYFCVDNLPVSLLPMLAELTLRAGTEIARAAVVVDVREGRMLKEFPGIYRKLKTRQNLNPVLIFLEAAEPALVRRFSETRRPHPLAPDRSAIEGIREERGAMGADPQASPTTIIDTSEMTVHELRHFFTGVARAAARRAPSWSSPSSASGSSTASRSTPTCCSTSASCRIRISLPTLRPHTGRDAEVVRVSRYGRR